MPRYLGFAVIAFAVLSQAAQAADIRGVVTGPKGPEAGVWVIAETTDLPTKYTKVVVTDDKGRYLIPDLPQASYSVRTRGYGLVDSPVGLAAWAAANDVPLAVGAHTG